MPGSAIRGLLTATLAFWLLPASAGGGGVMQTDRCVVSMGFMDAHLTIYQPETRGSEKFCDSVPDLTDTVFVLDYLHDSLNQAPIEFRIIRDATGLGRFAKWPDVEKLADLEAVTVFHRAPVTRAGGSFQVEHRFEKESDYLVLVTAGHPSEDKVYHAVAPLQVGGTRWLLWGGIGLAMVVVLSVFVWRMRRPRTGTP